MYKNIKSCVQWRTVIFSFQSYRGVRQGVNLSPILFAIFLNDLESYLESNNASGVNLELKFDNLTLFLKLSVLLYADDTVIFGTDEKQFKDNLNLFFEYTKIWKLDVKFDKTKVTIFGTRNDDRFVFKIGNRVLSIRKEFKYLGVIFAKIRSFQTALKSNTDQAKKATH